MYPLLLLPPKKNRKQQHVNHTQKLLGNYGGCELLLQVKQQYIAVPEIQDQVGTHVGR
jgi:hypothetical protein